jgi:hypothetical protein
VLRAGAKRDCLALSHRQAGKHINDPDLRALERVIENLVAEMDTQEEAMVLEYREALPSAIRRPFGLCRVLINTGVMAMLA